MHSCITFLCGLFAECMGTAKQTGFSHGDFHASNILFDRKDDKFVLIDYGRSYIHPTYMELVDDPNVLQQLEEEVNGSRFPSAFTRTTHLQNDRNIDYNNNKEYEANAELNSFMMSIDIAGLTMALYMQFHSEIMTTY